MHRPRKRVKAVFSKENYPPDRIGQPGLVLVENTRITETFLPDMVRRIIFLSGN